MPDVPDAKSLAAAARMADRRAAQRGRAAARAESRAQVHPDYPAVRRQMVEHLADQTADTLAQAYALLGIADVTTVRAVEIEHWPTGRIGVVVIRRRTDQGVAGERTITERTWIDSEEQR